MWCRHSSCLLFEAFAHGGLSITLTPSASTRARQWDTHTSKRGGGGGGGGGGREGDEMEVGVAEEERRTHHQHRPCRSLRILLNIRLLPNSQIPRLPPSPTPPPPPPPPPPPLHPLTPTLLSRPQYLPRSHAPAFVCFQTETATLQLCVYCTFSHFLIESERGISGHSVEELPL